MNPTYEIRISPEQREILLTAMLNMYRKFTLTKRGENAARVIAAL